MPCARKKLASVQQSRAHSKETAKGPDNFLSPQPSLMETEKEWKVVQKHPTESPVGTFESPEIKPNAFATSTGVLESGSPIRQSAAVPRRSLQWRRIARNLAVSEVQVPEDLLRQSRLSMVYPKQSTLVVPEELQLKTVPSDISIDDLKQALRKISQEKRSVYRRLKSSGSSKKDSAIVATSVLQPREPGKVGVGQPDRHRIQWFQAPTSQAKQRTSSVQPKVASQEPEWFEDQSQQPEGTLPGSVKLASESHRFVEPSQQDCNPVHRARHYLGEKRIDTVSDELQVEPLRRQTETAAVLSGLISSRYSRHEPLSSRMSTSLAKQSTQVAHKTQPSKRSGNQPMKWEDQITSDLIGNHISVQKQLVLDESQVKDPFPRDRKPPIAVMLYKSLSNAEPTQPSEAHSRRPTEGKDLSHARHAKSRDRLAEERRVRTRASTQVDSAGQQLAAAARAVDKDKTQEIKLGSNRVLSRKPNVQVGRALLSIRDAASSPKVLEETIPTHLLKPRPTLDDRRAAAKQSQEPVRCEFKLGSGGLKDLILDTKQIGRGSYATVRTGYHIPSRLEVAVKVYDKLKMADTRRRANLAHELQNLAEMEHSSVVKLYTKIEDATKIYLVMEFGGALHLKDFVKSRKEGWPTLSESRLLFTKVVEGVQHIHAKGVVHRDLKLQNIVLKSLDSPKIVDFGFSRKGLFAHFEESCGTPNYMAPELLSSRKKSMAVYADIWALGVILYYLSLKKYPFKGRNEEELFGQIKSGKLDLKQICNPSLADLLSKLLHPEQQKRPLCADILIHPWIRNS